MCKRYKLTEEIFIFLTLRRTNKQIFPNKIQINKINIQQKIKVLQSLMILNFWLNNCDPKTNQKL